MHSQNQNNPKNQNNMGTGERARPVLGSQPTPLGTTPFKYVDDQGLSLELVLVTPYYVKEPPQSQMYNDSTNEHDYEGSDHMVSIKAHTLMISLTDFLESLMDITTTIGITPTGISRPGHVLNVKVTIG